MNQQATPVRVMVHASPAVRLFVADAEALVELVVKNLLVVFEESKPIGQEILDTYVKRCAKQALAIAGYSHLEYSTSVLDGSIRVELDMKGASSPFVSTYIH